MTRATGLTHVQGAYGAPTRAGGGAANGRRTTFWGANYFSTGHYRP